MNDRDPDVAPDEGVTASGHAQPVRDRPVRRHSPVRRWLILIVLVIVLAPLAIFALWSTIALHYTYSRGDRAGYVQKLSQKGWICKTWEGELAQVNYPGAMQQLWTFSVRSDSIAQLIQQNEGRMLSLHYEQHPHVPSSCFGDTEYFVTGIRVLNR